MPYDFAQFLLTVLFDFVFIGAIVFILMACGLEASRRKYQQQYQHQQLKSHPLPPAAVAPLSLPAAAEPVKIPVRSAQYDYVSA